MRKCGVEDPELAPIVTVNDDGDHERYEYALADSNEDDVLEVVEELLNEKAH